MVSSRHHHHHLQRSSNGRLHLVVVLSLVHATAAFVPRPTAPVGVASRKAPTITQLSAVKWRSDTTPPSSASVPMDLLPDVVTNQKLSTHAMMALREHFRSVLYLCLDEQQDMSVWPMGFQTLRRIAPTLDVRHIPINVSAPLSFKQADKVIAALDTMEGPTLITDFTGHRSSAVKAIYAGVSTSMTSSALLTYAEQRQMSFLADPYLVQWVEAVLARNERQRPLDVHTLGPKPGTETPSSSSSSSPHQSYVVVCPESGGGILVDPGSDTLLRANQEVGGLLDFLYSVSTKTGTVKSLKVDAPPPTELKEGDKLEFGNGRYLHVRVLPGPKTPSVCLLTDDFTTAFVGDCITALQDPERPAVGAKAAGLWYDGLHTQLLRLPKETLLLHSGKGAKGAKASTVGAELTFNPFMRMSRKEFVEALTGKKLDSRKLTTPADSNSGDVE